MEYNFEGVSKLIMSHTPGDETSKHVETKIYLEVSDNLDRSKYLDKSDLPNKEGTQALTLAFVMGLVTNIHQAHKLGYWDSAKHLRYIIEQLEKGFSEVAFTEQGEY